MGITYCDAIAYWAAKLAGVSFECTVTVGHQRLYLHRQEVKALQRHYHAEYGDWPKSLGAYKWGEFADTFLREFLDISRLIVLDAAAYEGADTIHDLNQPVPDKWHNQFDVIIDCGSIEHIFNVPVALRNLANMLAVGGTLFITTPANNLMGHGFYQFSPELMFRVFSQENGFAVQCLSLREGVFPSVELTKSRKVYRVSDPQDVRRRVGLMSRRPAMMMVEAIKRADVDVLATFPYQSDYSTAWSAIDLPAAPKSLYWRTVRRVLGLLPRSVSAQITGRHQKHQFSFRNSAFYKSIPAQSRDSNHLLTRINAFVIRRHN